MADPFRAFRQMERHFLAVNIRRSSRHSLNQWGQNAAYRVEYRRVSGNPDPKFGLRTSEGWAALRRAFWISWPRASLQEAPRADHNLTGHEK